MSVDDLTTAHMWLGLDSVVRYFDRAGNQIPMVRWTELRADFGYQVLRKTVVGSWEVSTAWLGLDHSYIADVPHIFETMVFEIAESNSTWGFPYHEEMGWGEFTSRYSTEGQAIEGHEATVREVRQLFLPAVTR